MEFAELDQMNNVILDVDVDTRRNLILSEACHR